MPICGLVLTLDVNSQTAEEALASLSVLPGLTLGPREGARVAAVLESQDQAEHELRVEALTALCGTHMLELAYADFSDIASVNNGARLMSRRKRENRL